MTTSRHLATAAPLALALSAALASPAGAASSALPPSSDALLLGVSDVISGTVSGTPGNRHQAYLLYSKNGTSGYLRSWSCPAGATVTPGWASSRCTHRLTQNLRATSGAPLDAWISSTGRSGTLSGKVVGVNRSTGYRRSLDVGLVASATSGAEQLAADGHYYWSRSVVRGRLGGGGVYVVDSGFFGWITG